MMICIDGFYNAVTSSCASHGRRAMIDVGIQRLVLSGRYSQRNPQKFHQCILSDKFQRPNLSLICDVAGLTFQHGVH
jgi:hypothetical protein